MRTLARTAVLLSLAAAPAAGQAPSATPGTVLPRVATAADPAQSYALYLPSRWEAGRRWPVLVVMDPEGHAGVPMERFRAAAERNGWIVASSWNTAAETDSALALNDRAVDAVVADVIRRYAADSTRLYFAGFSGTARYAWTLPGRLARPVAGIIGVGAGLPQQSAVVLPRIRETRPFPWFGAAGGTDYNLDEMARLDTSLVATALPHRFEPFDGGHEWLPAELAGRAMEWMQLQSIALGQAPRDTVWMATAYAAGLERCRGMEARGDRYGAWAGYHALVGDYLGLRDVSAAQARGSALAQDAAVRRERIRRGEQALEFTQFRAVIDAVFTELMISGSGNVERRLVNLLDLDKLRRREADAGGSAQSRQMATRMLNTAFAVGTHEAELSMRNRRYRHAASALRIARMARPAGAGVCWPLARALAQAHDRDAAIEALGCALQRDAVTADAAAREPMLEPLRADPRFAALLARPAPPASSGSGSGGMR